MTNTISRLRKIALRASYAAVFCAFGLFFAVSAKAQFIGFVGPQTVTSTPFPASTACTGANQFANVPNLGQSAHVAIFVPSNIKSGTFVIQGSDDGVNFQNISEVAALNTGPASNPNIYVVGTGYYAVVRIAVNCSLTGAPTFSVQYTGTSVTPGQLFGSAATTQFDKGISTGESSTSNFNFLSFQPPFGSSAGTLLFLFTGPSAPTNSTVAVTCTTNGLNTRSVSYTILTFTLASVTTLQSIPVPATVCPLLQVVYTAGAGGNGTNFIDYVFNYPGQSTPPPANLYTHITGTTATAVKATTGFLHTLSINLGGAGTVSVFDLASASCTGTPATNQVAIITATANTLQTFTYDVNLLNGICVKASAAMDITVASQ